MCIKGVKYNPSDSLFLSFSAGSTDCAVQELAHGRDRDEWGRSAFYFFVNKKHLGFLSQWPRDLTLPLMFELRDVVRARGSLFFWEHSN